MLSLKLAFRNLFRNTRRTVLTCVLITSSLITIILVDGLMIGMVEIMVSSITKTLTGEAQVHRRGFLDNFDVDLYIADPGPLYETLDDDAAVTAWSPRVLAGSMVASSYNVSGGLVAGIDAEREPGVSRVEEAMIEGSFLSGGDRELIIGEPLADLLEVGIGDRIVITTAMVDTGEIAQELFRVSGIFEIGQPELDEGFVFINLASAQKLIGLGSGIHEIAIQFNDPALGQDRNNPLLGRLTDDQVVAQVWLDLNPAIGGMMDMLHLPTIIIGSVLFLLASLGVINSLFMSIYERIYEFGVVRAIGTTPFQVWSLVMLEALMLGILACSVGVVLAWLLNDYFSVNGIPMGEMEFSGIVLDGNMYTRQSVAQYTLFPVYVVLLTVVAAIYPAVFASRIVPAEALHKSL